MRRRLLALIAVAAAAVGVLPSTAAPAGGESFVAVTSAERRETRPLAQAVVAAYRSGAFAPLCTLFSPTEVRRVHGSLARCRKVLAAARHPCAGRCSFAVGLVLGAYVTDRDEKLRRKTIAWVYRVRRHPAYTRGELEIRLRKDRGHWALLPDIVEAGTARR